MIRAEWVDIDFSRQPQYVFGHRQPDEATQRQLCASMPSYEATFGTIAESEWPRLAGLMKEAGGGSSQLVTRIFNQGSEGSCVGNAGTQAHQICQARQFGKENVVQLSAVSLYQLIGRSPGSGAMVSDALDEGTATGIIPLDMPENRQRFGDVVMPHTGFYTKRPSGWEAVAKRFTYEETYVVQSKAGLITALLRQEPVVVGRAGHSIVYCEPVYDGGSLLVKYVNSWGDWGENGYGYDSSRLINSSAGWAYVVRSVKDWRTA